MKSILRSLIAVGLLLAAMLAVGRAAPADREQAQRFFREGNGWLDQEHFAEAAAAFTRAIEADPDYAEAYHNRGIANEMVDRAQAIQDFQRFIELAGDSPDLRFDVARIRARLQLLKSMPKLPESLQPSHYVTEAGDYYWDIASSSQGEEWKQFPVKVFLGSAPQNKWQEGTREAFDIWREVFPLQLVALPQDADIRMGWEISVSHGGHGGETYEWVDFRRVGNEMTGRRIAIIRINLERPWSKKEMRAIVLHEVGHALGIKGHSKSKGDIMYASMQEKARQIDVPLIPYPFFWRTLVDRPSQRDINTLIHLYNSAGTITRFQ
jgi:predicted Zn-dependent protease